MPVRKGIWQERVLHRMVPHGTPWYRVILHQTIVQYNTIQYHTIILNDIVSHWTVLYPILSSGEKYHIVIKSPGQKKIYRPTTRRHHRETRKIARAEICNDEMAVRVSVVVTVVARSSSCSCSSCFGNYRNTGDRKRRRRSTYWQDHAYSARPRVVALVTVCSEMFVLQIAYGRYSVLFSNYSRRRRHRSRRERNAVIVVVMIVVIAF